MDTWPQVTFLVSVLCPEPRPEIVLTAHFRVHTSEIIPGSPGERVRRQMPGPTLDLLDQNCRVGEPECRPGKWFWALLGNSTYLTPYLVLCHSDHRTWGHLTPLSSLFSPPYHILICLTDLGRRGHFWSLASINFHLEAPIQCPSSQLAPVIDPRFDKKKHLTSSGKCLTVTDTGGPTLWGWLFSVFTEDRIIVERGRKTALNVVVQISRHHSFWE